MDKKKERSTLRLEAISGLESVLFGATAVLFAKQISKNEFVVITRRDEQGEFWATLFTHPEVGARTV